jgi:hypothetical protein
MTRTQTLSRLLAAALATSALAAPAAGARPVDVQPVHAKPVVTAVRGTDVSAPDQQAPGVHQDLRSADAIDAVTPRGVAPGRSSSVHSADDTPWSTIGFGLAGACLALAGTALTAGRIRRSRVAA